MAAELLTTKQIKSLKEHKYKAEGQSFSEPLMQMYWKWLVEQIPLTWAPNTLTLVGLLMNVISTLFLIIYSPDGNSEAPRWVYFFCAIGLFVYQSLDAIDGKQARRTQTNTPLGELFDHGCDSLSTVFVMLGCCLALKLGQNPMVLMFEVCLSEVCFYMAHWQTYLPIIGIPLRFVCVICSSIPSFFFIYKTSTMILQGGAGKNKSTVATSIYTDQPSLYLLSFGFVVSKVTNSLVVAHMCKSEMHLLDWSLMGPMMLFMNQYFNSKIPENFLLWIVFILSAQGWLTYSYRICGEICAHLNIYCFNITETPSGNKGATNGQKEKNSN
ncbi:CEPT1-like protein [Mya arenaria]|uniref:CEPT1-like protein n=1 Tax=Mya arenaria TaxID=6604 RepID=A0ABY7DY08_MYAAR|nr:CEPT1-like protein [Mya arenaria]